MFENFKFGLFVKILSFLVCIFLIPLLVCGYLLTQYTMSSYKEEVLSLNFNTTNFIQQMIDENLEDIDVVQLLISQNKEIMDFVDSSLNYDDKAYYAKCVSDEINKYRLYKNSISEIHLYSKSSGCIVTRNSYYDVEEYYNTFLLDSEFSKEKWKEILSTPNNNQELIKIKSSISNSTTAAVVLPSIRDSKGNFATLLIVLNENYIVNTFNQLIPDQSNSYFVITSEDEVLIKSKELPFEINVAERFSNKYDKPSFYGGYVIFSSCSANEKMNYISIVSEDEILGGVQLNNKILMICIMFMALILILLAFVFSNKTFTPIRNLAILGIGEKKYSFDSIKDFQGFIVNIVNSNTQLNETIVRQKEYINDSFFKSFIYDSMSMSEKTIKTIFSETAISTNEKKFRAAIIGFGENEFDELDNLNIVSGIRDVFEKYRIKFCVIPNEKKEIILLIAYDRSNDYIGEAFEEIVNLLKDVYHIDAYVGVGRLITDVGKFTRSYEDALFKINVGEQRVAVAESVSSPASYDRYFEFIRKDKLIYDIKNGEYDSVRALLSKVKEITFIEHTTTYGIQNYIRYVLDGIFREAIEESSISDIHLRKYIVDCDNALNANSPNESFEQIETAILSATERILKHKERKEDNLIEEIANYVKQNYSDPDLSLKSIIEELGVGSYKSVSEEFKKKTGMKFIDYLHEIRNREAKRLLIESELMIFEISEKVGYLSGDAFGKAFKKINGVTPGQFRSGKKKNQ